MTELPHRYVPYPYMEEPEKCLNCPHPRGDAIHVEGAERSREQPRVPPETLSWCISAFALEQWKERGEMLQRAHQCREKDTRHYGVVHFPVCGTYMRHVKDGCAKAPESWPACRKCARKPSSTGVPAAFYGLEPRP